MYGGRIQHDVPTAQLRGRGRQQRIHQQSRRAALYVPEQCQQQHQGLGGRIGNPDLPSNQKGRFRHGRGAGVLELCKRDHRQKNFCRRSVCKEPLPQAVFQCLFHAILLSQHAHHKALAADFRRPRRLYLYQAEKTVFLRCSG